MADVENTEVGAILNLLVGLDEILYGVDGIEYVLLNPVASTIPK
jgi:hypothetical protein